jgi:hypothetical protein
MNTNIDNLLKIYSANFENSYNTLDPMHISNKGKDEQLLVLFLMFNLIGDSKKSQMTIKEGITWPFKKDNFINYFNSNQDGDLILVNSKSLKTNETKLDQIKSQISGILRNIFQLEKGNKVFAEKSFVTHFNSVMDDLEGADLADLTKQVYVVVDAELTINELSEIDGYANSAAGDYENLSLSVIDLSRFSKIVDNSGSNSERKAYLDIFNKNGFLSYENGQENAVIVNLSAKSLKRTYQQYGMELFDFNLRYFISTKSQDGEVVKTITENPSDFWLFNNGLVITCQSYNLEGPQLTLNDFTIVNGAQTTSIIGKADFDQDFPVIAKIISIGKSSKEKVDRMTEIAVFANSQKPIKPRDLKANTKEQRNLQRQLHEEGVFLAIKRGEKSKLEIHEEWQETTNEELGQLILAGVLQYPGSARSQKSSIFKKNYNPIFKRNSPFPSKYLIDLLKLYSVVKGIDYKDRGYAGLKAGIFANSKLFIFSSLVFILSSEGTNRLNYQDYRDDELAPPHKSLALKSIDNASLMKLVDRIVDLITDSYSSVKANEYKNESYPITNFTKLDSNYEDYLLPQLKTL